MSDDTVGRIRDLLLSQSKAGRLRSLLDSVYGATEPVRRIPGMLGQFIGDAAPGGALNPELTPENMRTAAEYASMTPNPIGDVASLGLAADDLRKGDYGSAALNSVGMLPFVPAMGAVVRKLPSEYGTSPLPEGMVRLYHQSNPEAVESIGKEGLRLDKAKGIEGPKSIYADENGFYGKPDDVPTVEFMVPKNQWQQPFVLNDVPATQVIGIHLPWHRMARYLLDPSNKSSLNAALSGRFDNRDGDTAKAVEYVKELMKEGR